MQNRQKVLPKLENRRIKIDSEFKLTKFQKRLVERLEQLEFCTSKRGATCGYGNHVGEDLSYLRDLRKENPTEHDQLINSNERCKEFFNLFPDWTDSYNLQSFYKEQDVGFSMAFFAAKNSMNDGVLDNNAFNKKIEQMSDVANSNKSGAAFFKAIKNAEKSGDNVLVCLKKELSEAKDEVIDADELLCQSRGLRFAK